MVPHTLIESQGKDVLVQYACPKGKNDRKRWGRQLTIHTDGFSIKLDGRAINSIKSVLEKAGELN